MNKVIGAFLATVILVTTIALAQAPPPKQVQLPTYQLDDATAAAFKPLLERRQKLQEEMTQFFTDWRTEVGVALATNKPPLDPQAYTVDQTATKAVPSQQPPQRQQLPNR